MRKKLKPKRIGFATIFLKEAVECLQRLEWPGPLGIPLSWINAINTIAAEPNYKESLAMLTRAYAEAPDLTAALLNDLRGHWRALEKSKAGKLKKFIQSGGHTHEGGGLKWQEGFPRSIDNRWFCEKWHSLGAGKIGKLRHFLWYFDRDRKFFDQQIVTSFSIFPGGGRVTLRQVFKAREWVAENKVLLKKKWHGLVKCKNVKYSPFVSIWSLPDKQIVWAFKASPGGFLVKEDDVVQARQWVARRQIEEDEFLKKHLDSDRMIHIEGRVN